MTTDRQCPRCSAVFDTSGGFDLCPACLLRLALSESAGTAHAEAAASPWTPDDSEVIGHEPLERVGPYRLLNVLGVGGMGIVYLAEQERPLRRRVALKIIKRGLDTRQVVVRFEAERQTLARMEHPHIASVFDAGATPDGRPYFVMEYVPGLPITDYCDDHGFSTRDRLALFAQVCGAVQHAHQKGAIHRDVKPSNVLVTEQDSKPVPKVIDFGIARATGPYLAEVGLFTESGTFVGTPEYMSPEQAEAGPDVDTRTDIYSLGVVLYELLVGSVPFAAADLRRASHAEIQRVIRETEPPKPSTMLGSLGATASAVAGRRRTRLPALAREIEGDLDWITLKAIEKDRGRRYSSASELAEDVRRYLENEPIIARPPSVGYRAGKFVRKHRGAVIAAAALVVALTVGLVASSALYIRAERARREASLERDAAQAARANAEAATGEAARQRDEALVARAAAAMEREAADVARHTVTLQRDEAAYQSYLSSLFAADVITQTGPVRTAIARLESTAPELRGWEWRYLRRAADSSLAVADPLAEIVAQGSAPVIRGPHVTFTPGGTELVASYPFGLAVVKLAVDAGRLSVRESFRRPAPPRPGVTAPVDHVVGVSDHGDRLAVTSWAWTDYVCRAPDRGSMPPVSCMVIPTVGPGTSFPPGDRDRLRVREFPSGRELGLVEHPDVGVWTAENPRFLREITNPTAPGGFETRFSDAGKNMGGDVVAATFSGDNTRMASWSKDNVVHVWNLDARSLASTLRGHRGNMASVRFGPDGARIVSAASDGTVRVWRAETGEQVGLLNVADPMTLAVGPALVAIGTGDGTVRLWDPDNEAPPRRLVGHAGAITALAFSPDATRLASGSTDGRLRVWNAASGVETAVLRGSASVSSVAFAPDGMTVASGSSEGLIRLFPVGGADTSLQGHTAAPGALQFTPTGLASGGRDRTVRFWDVARGRESRKLELPPDNVTAVAIDPSGRSIAFTIIQPAPDRARKETRVIDLSTGRSMVLLPELDVVNAAVPAVAISPDGTHVAKADHDSRTGESYVQVWRLPSGEMVRTLTLERSYSTRWLRFANDGRRLALGGAGTRPVGVQPPAGTVLVWDFLRDRVTARLPLVNRGTSGAAFPGDDSFLVYSDGAQVKIWREGEPVRTLADGGPIAVSPDGTRIVTGLRVWDARRREILLTLRLPAGAGTVYSVAISPDGTQIAAATSTGAIHVWDAGSARPR